MSFRIVLIDERCKLEYSLNNLVCRKGNEETRVFIDEIKTIIINTQQAIISSALISELSKNKINIIFTDSEHNPVCETTPYHSNYYSYRKIKEQFSFDEERKSSLWQWITINKIINQAKNLEHSGHIKESEMLVNYSNQVELGDATNREGHSAKVYFNRLFGNDFSRNKECDINKYLNYGYSIILSSFNREICALGYLTELGIHHIGESNPYNLSCDFMEPLRPLVDKYVIENKVNDENFKDVFVNMLITHVEYNEKDILLYNAIRLYTEDVLSFLKNGDRNKLRIIKYE